MVGKIVGLAVGAIIAAAILPSAITDIVGANTTGWDTGTVAVWGLMSVLIALAAGMLFLRLVRS